MTSEERVKRFNDAEGTLHTIDGYSCPLCRNRGFICSLDENGIEQVEACKCSKTRETIRKAKNSGIGNLLDITFNRFMATEEWQKQIKASAERFCNDDNINWFYIGGQVGCGKTLICTIISGFYIKEGKSLKYMLWNEDVKKLKQIINDKEYQTVFKEYCDTDVLYIDDFLKTPQGKEPTSADISLAFDIINHRMRDETKITLISSEKFMDELLDYDEATMSRVYEKAGEYVITVPRDRSKNYRIPKKTNNPK